MIVVKYPYSSCHLIHITTAQIVNLKKKSHNPNLIKQSIYHHKQLFPMSNGINSWKIRYVSAGR